MRTWRNGRGWDVHGEVSRFFDVRGRVRFLDARMDDVLGQRAAEQRWFDESGELIWFLRTSAQMQDAHAFDDLASTLAIDRCP